MVFGSNAHSDYLVENRGVVLHICVGRASLSPAPQMSRNQLIFRKNFLFFVFEFTGNEI